MVLMDVIFHYVFFFNLESWSAEISLFTLFNAIFLFEECYNEINERLTKNLQYFLCFTSQRPILNYKYHEYINYIHFDVNEMNMTIWFRNTKSRLKVPSHSNKDHHCLKTSRHSVYCPGKQKNSLPQCTSFVMLTRPSNWHQLLVTLSLS